ncbi:cysteine desufuration protein SufE [Flexivirga endophytica]|uniref:Cysteine desufuration protein SufE n=1 Tax=Flexivirga endophytica TaxID=1849103 RepID=A0A916SU29_9MICO|nr:SufE family protein [Flexivirga endophytica]GGB18023.1 cysteine desufuration protein SufE [Flexivirga endophytica]GHB37585.1 cysteine desufuration protein SufE [Flexivirga endophytica]
MSEETDVSELPAPLAELIDEFEAVGPKDRLQLLLELSEELPALPARYADQPDLLEQVHECQSPLFLAVELTDGDIHLFFDAPKESPTTRGFAGILHTGLDGQPAQAVLDVPDDVPFKFGLAEAVSPLRMRGMVAMLSRIKRQTRVLLSG